MNFRSTSFVRSLPLALAATLSGVAAHAEEKLVPAQSEIAFSARQMGVPVDGHFKKFDAQVAFDPKNPAAARIGFTIDLASATLGSPDTEAELVKPDWFDTRKFPQATFQSTSVKAAGPGKFEIAGKLTIKGAAQSVVVPATLAQAGPNTAVTGAFLIHRLDFKIGDGDWKDTSMVANDVNVRFKLTLTGVPAL